MKKEFLQKKFYPLRRNYFVFLFLHCGYLHPLEELILAVFEVGLDFVDFLHVFGQRSARVRHRLHARVARIRRNATRHVVDARRALLWLSLLRHNVRV